LEKIAHERAAISAFSFPSGDPMKLSIVVPCYNEKNTIQSVIAAVKAAPFDEATARARSHQMR